MMKQSSTNTCCKSCRRNQLIPAFTAYCNTEFITIKSSFTSDNIVIHGGAKNATRPSVYAPRSAEFMVNLIIDRLEENSKILDPCIGQNIFLETIHSKNSDLRSISLDGVEIDSDLVDKKTINFFDSDHANLFLGDFFDFCTDELFDFAILNPPYIRQENIENKSGKFKILGLDRNQVSKKSNLFVYFILKSINHLKSSGRLIAIVYDSWLYSDYGSSFRNTLSDLGHVDDIYHFQQDIFPDALVGATVISFSKKKRNIPTRYFQFQNLKILI